MTYLALARAGFRRWSSYRAATLAGVFTNTVFGFIRVAILLAALAAGGDIAGYSPADAITYTWVTQALIMMIAMWNWVDLATRIQTGDIVTDLQRPIDLQAAYLAEDQGRALYQLLARGLPPFLVGALVYDLEFPDSLEQWIAFAISLELAVDRELRHALHREPVRVLGARLAGPACAVECVHDGRVGFRRSPSRSSRRGRRACSPCCRGRR